MRRAISIERLYFLGDYKNIKVGTSLDDIPEEVASDSKAVGLLLKGLMLDCDMAYQEYREYNERLKVERETDMMEALKEEKETVEKEYNSKVTLKEKRIGDE